MPIVSTAPHQLPYPGAFGLANQPLGIYFSGTANVFTNSIFGGGGPWSVTRLVDTDQSSNELSNEPNE